MGHVQCERLPKSKMASSDDRFTFEIVHELRFESGLTRNFAADFSLQIFNNQCDQKFQSPITNFQDLVAKVKNLVALAPVLGAILCPVLLNTVFFLLINNFCLYIFVICLLRHGPPRSAFASCGHALSVNRSRKIKKKVCVCKSVKCATDKIHNNGIYNTQNSQLIRM